MIALLRCWVIWDGFPLNIAAMTPGRHVEAGGAGQGGTGHGWAGKAGRQAGRSVCTSCNFEFLYLFH